MDPELLTLQRLAEENGLKTADKVAPPPPKPREHGTGNPEFEYVDQTPKRPRRSDDERQAEDELDHHWVGLIALERPAPRYFGDNRGCWPLHVERQADWRRLGSTYDHQQPATRAVRLAVIGVNSKAGAERLKTALDEALTGRQEKTDGDELRFRFRNGVDFGPFEVWWTPLMQDALMQCEMLSGRFEVFTREEHERMVKAKAREIMEKRGRF